jgi:hypothetical protein
MSLNNRISALLRKEFHLSSNNTLFENIIYLIHNVKYNINYSKMETSNRLNKLLRIKLGAIIPIDGMNDNQFRRWLCQFVRIQLGDTLVDERTIELNIIEAYTNTLLHIDDTTDGSNVTCIIKNELSPITESDGIGKLGVARSLYAENKDSWKSSDFISYFVANLNMTVLGARTYLYKVRKEFNSTHC